MALMVSVSGIRGIFGTDLTPENLARFTAAFGTWAGGTVVVGRDTRVTGEICERIVIASLQAVGCDVIRLGIVPTPTVAMAVLRHQAAGGIVISASHNPAQWNALKLLNRASEFLDAGQGAEVIGISEDPARIRYVDYSGIGMVSDDTTIADWHIEQILALPYIDADAIRRRTFAVAVDAVNGAGSLIVPRLLRRLGVDRVETIHCTPDGRFPHNPEPLPEHLADIMAFTRSSRADIGVITDPDADRLALCDQNGMLWGEEYTLAASLDFHLGVKAGPVAVNLSSSRITDVVAERYGQVCHRSAVGEIHVVKKMQEVGAVSGGEGNGGVINPDLHPGRDALVGIAMILQLLTDRGVDAATYRASLPDFHMAKLKAELRPRLDADAILAELGHHYRNERVSTIDGVKIDFADGWVHLRKSNTEPIIRVYAEGPSPEAADALARPILNRILES
jgi:phosphomannomutase